MCWLAPINVDSFDQVLDHSQGILPPTLQSADVHHLLSVSALVFALHCAQQSRLQNGGNHSSVTEPVNRPIGFLLATIYFYKSISLFLVSWTKMQPCQSVEKTRVIEDCCHGFARTPDNSSCVPICAEQCLHGTCVGPDKCECEPGYGGATCMIGNLFICWFFIYCPSVPC